MNENTDIAINNILIIKITQLMLFVFGIVYATLITFFPLHSKWTWAEVVAGVSVTLSGASIIQLVQLKENKTSISVISTPFVAFVLTGFPMIVGQVLKYTYIGFQQQETLNQLESLSTR